MEESNIWIKITFNSCGEFEGKDEFLEELREVCVVQERELWYPAACTGGEFFAEVLIDSPLAHFVKDVVICGVAWDLLKAACTKIWEAFSRFAKKNEGFDLQTLTLAFNDTTVKVNGTLGNHYGFLVSLFHSMPKHWARFQQLGLKDIIEIELPVLPNEDNEELLQCYYTEEDTTPENCLWHIQYELGLETCYYSPALMKIV